MLPINDLKIRFNPSAGEVEEEVKWIKKLPLIISANLSADMFTSSS